MKRILTLGAVVAVTTAGLSVAPALGVGQPAAATPRAVTMKADPHFSPRDRAAELQSARAHAPATASRCASVRDST
jgi:hypothetical protein